MDTSSGRVAQWRFESPNGAVWCNVDGLLVGTVAFIGCGIGDENLPQPEALVVDLMTGAQVAGPFPGSWGPGGAQWLLGKRDLSENPSAPRTFLNWHTGEIRTAAPAYPDLDSPDLAARNVCAPFVQPYFGSMWRGYVQWFKDVPDEDSRRPFADGIWIKRCGTRGRGRLVSDPRSSRRPWTTDYEVTGGWTTWLSGCSDIAAYEIGDRTRYEWPRLLPARARNCIQQTNHNADVVIAQRYAAPGDDWSEPFEYSLYVALRPQRCKTGRPANPRCTRPVMTAPR